MSHASDSLRTYIAGRTDGPGYTPASGVLVVGAGKGGVGASTIATLMAVEASRVGQKVLLVDGDEHLGQLHLLLGMDTAGPGVAALRGGQMRPEDLVRSVVGSLYLLPGGGSGVEGTLAVSTAERRMLFRRIADLHEHFDLVVVDGGSRLEAVTAAMTAGVERLLVVTATDRVSLASSYALVKVARGRFGEVPVELVVNRVAGNQGLAAHRIVDGAAERFLRADVPLAGAVPDDDAVQAAVETGGLLAVETTSPGRVAAFQIVDRVLNEHAARATSGAPVIPLIREG